MRAPSRAGGRPGEQLRERRRQQQQAGDGDATAEAVARALRRLRELRDDQEAREHRDADHEAGQVRRRDGGLAQHREVDQRLRRRGPRRDEQRRPRAAPPAIAPTFAGEPQPHSPACETPSRIAASAARQQRGAEPVDPRGRRRAARAGCSRCAANAGRQRDQVDPEQPVEVEVVDDHARQRQADAAADAEDRADHPEAGRRPARAGTCRARSRTPAGTRRRRRPAARGRRSRPRSTCAERVDDRAGREDEQDRGEHAALAVEVAELADDRRGDRGATAGTPVSSHGRRRVLASNSSPSCRQRRDDERLRERERDARQEQHEQHLGGVRGGGRGREVRRRHGGS